MTSEGEVALAILLSHGNFFHEPPSQGKYRTGLIAIETCIPDPKGRRSAT